MLEILLKCDVSRAKSFLEKELRGLSDGKYNFVRKERGHYEIYFAKDGNGGKIKIGKFYYNRVTRRTFIEFSEFDFDSYYKIYDSATKNKILVEGDEI